MLRGWSVEPWKLNDLRSLGGQNCSCTDIEVQPTLITAATFEQVSLRLRMANLLVLSPVVGIPKFLLKPDPNNYEFKRWCFQEVAMSVGLWLLDGVSDLIKKRLEGTCPLFPPCEKVPTVYVEQISSRH